MRLVTSRGGEGKEAREETWKGSPVLLEGFFISNLAGKSYAFSDLSK